MTNNPFIYFDGVSDFGTLPGITQVELIANLLVPGDIPNTTDLHEVPVAHLRCNIHGAKALIQALHGAIDLLESPTQQPESDKAN